jgi:hypothetical protein
MEWLVFNGNMQVIGTVVADGYTEAFMVARCRFGYVEYIEQL